MLDEEGLDDMIMQAKINYINWYNSLTDADIAVDVIYNQLTNLVDITFKDGHIVSFNPNVIIPNFDYQCINSFELSSHGTDIHNEDCDFDMHIVDLVRLIGESND